MKVILFGATGMVGQGVLRECLPAQDVETVLVVGRTAVEASHPKLRQIVRADLFDCRGVEDQLRGYDACLFCLGVSASDVDEAGYVRLNHDLPLAVASTLVKLNPAMTFLYVSGSGTDATEHGRVMWARVKGKTENALQQLGFRSVYLFRPGLIVPLHGIRSKTRAYRWFYQCFGWALPGLRKLWPNQILDTEQIGQAMLEAVRRAEGNRVAESAAIHRLAMGAGNRAT